MNLSRVPVEVEPISEARWSRIERELFARLDAEPLPTPAAAPVARFEPPRRSHALAWTATVAAAAVILFAILYKGGSAPTSDRVRLATSDSASEFMVGESSLKVAPKSLVMVSGDDEHGIDVVLDRGTVTCAVAPRMGRPPFRLDAGEVRVRVVGTKFTVKREDGEIRVDVDEGAVEVSSRGSVIVLHAGEHWPARARPAGPESTVVPTARDTAEPSATPGSRAQARRTRSRPAAADTAMIDPDLPDPADDPPPAPGPAPVTPTAQQAFEAAARRERTNPEEAAAGYRQLAASHTAWAQIALFALGRLEFDRGNRPEATRVLNSYLTRYPHGINADDARELLRRMR